MMDADFAAKIEAVDRKFMEDELQLQLRPFHAYILHFDGVLGAGGDDLFEQIKAWYRHTYGPRVDKCGCFYLPVMIRGEIYFSKVPMIFGTVRLNPLETIENCSPAIVLGMEQGEIERLAREIMLGIELYQEVFKLRQSACSANCWEFADAGRRDIEAGILSLKSESASQTNDCHFHAQQAAEKFLKAVVIQKTSVPINELRKTYGHNLNRLFKTLSQTDRDFFSIQSDVTILSEISMDIRYTSQQIRKKAAVEVWHTSLRVAGLCACKLMKAGRVYKSSKRSRTPKSPDSRSRSFGI